jgi:hypothetical protein
VLLTQNARSTGLSLRVERVELLFKALIRGLAGIDRTTEAELLFDRSGEEAANAVLLLVGCFHHFQNGCAFAPSKKHEYAIMLCDARVRSATDIGFACSGRG